MVKVGFGTIREVTCIYEEDNFIKNVTDRGQGRIVDMCDSQAFAQETPTMRLESIRMREHIYTVIDSSG